MSDSVHDIPAEQRKLMLQAMANSAAFALFCDAWDAKLDLIQKRINDPATSDAETRELKLVRKQCVETNHPRKIAETLIRSISGK